MNILEQSFPTLPHKLVTIESSLIERRKIIDDFQEEKVKILVSTPGIIGRGVELRSAQSVRLVVVIQLVILLVFKQFSFRVCS